MMLFSHFHDIQALSSIVHPFHGFCMQIMLVFPQINKSHQKQHITAQTGSEQCKMAKTVRDFRGLSGNLPKLIVFACIGFIFAHSPSAKGHMFDKLPVHNGLISTISNAFTGKSQGHFQGLSGTFRDMRVLAQIDQYCSKADQNTPTPINMW